MTLSCHRGGSVIRLLKQKLGASMALALVVVLICTLIGSAALAIAANNFIKNKGAQSRLQTYNAVESAALLLRDSLDSSKITMTYDVDATGIITHTSYAVSDTNMAQNLVNWTSSPQNELTFSIIAEEMSNVTVTLQKDSVYGKNSCALRFIITSHTEEYTMILLINGNRDELMNDAGQHNVIITLERGIISKGGQYD